MPRGQKSKVRAREKRLQAQSASQSVKGAQAAAAEAEESASFPLSGESPTSSPAPGPSQKPQRARATSSPGEGVSCPRSHEAAKSQDEESARASRAALSSRRARRDPLNRRVCRLVQFLLEKLQRKEPITQAALLRIVGRKYKEQYPEVLRRACERLELIFGLELKAVTPNSHTYAFVNKLGLPIEGDLCDDEVVPKTGLLNALLGVIFMKGNHATEEEIWEFLGVFGIHPGTRHVIVGEPREFLMEDLVQQRYLEYHRMPGSGPPRYAFQWGPRAYVETSKMKVLEFLAKISGTVPTAFPNLFEEALRHEEDRAWLTAAAMVASF
ncbi:melanoma-associated antigen B1-like [Pteronotus mesoamericanus]|uniref:melanoma-associated antigen B1-like n=1 Tax=Pteronotus mesoamericanus TaxID=1884717 RepID=UPI0023EDB119|nr:melanoma-associated antigen B1-like [Pteronotus parnellii mesoamericanus]XP_054436989.1 melanoma-associated antigen B1-like [Pteronotus parnellii mesoamericanus]